MLIFLNKSIYRILNVSKIIKFKEEARGTIKLDMLDTNAIFIIDAGSESLYY